MRFHKGSRPALATVVAAVLTTTACSGDAPASSSDPADSPAVGSAAAGDQLAPAAFADAVADDRTFVVNVHVPDEGSIAGTDAAIPYDEVEARAGELPRGRDARIAVYCLTGRMSAVAGETLRRLGYTDVVELDGGMAAWTAEGRVLLPPTG